MDKVECVVIGAGVIGLAIARRLALAGREVIVLEAAEGIGTVTSSRNSEVIHAGIYYPAGSLMARMCVSGKRALYEYCSEHGIPHRNCGKLIVATTVKETEKLQSIRAHAEANGVVDLQTLSGNAARALEPALNCDAACLAFHRHGRQPRLHAGAARRRRGTARPAPSTRRCCAPRRQRGGSNSTPAATPR
jgi:L-2-hydroxyglutarate oxidase LhgO